MLYGYGRDHIISTTHDILQRVPQTQLYQYIIGYEPEENHYYRSPIRQDNVPGTWFEWRQGILYHIDYAEKRPVRDCFQILMDLKGLSLPNAVKELSRVFNAPELPIIYPELATKATISKLPYQEGQRKKEHSHGLLPEQGIFFKPRTFEEEDRAFWFTRYGIRKNQLIDDAVFPIFWYKYFHRALKEWFVVRPSTPTYAYTDFEDGKVKIYNPLAPDKKKRFMTNCGANDIGSIRKLPPFSGSQLLIAKSYKDWRVLRNEGVSAVWFQNEGMVPDMNILRRLCLPYEEVVVFFDNDSAGIHAAEKLQTILTPEVKKVRTVIVPPSQNNSLIKDPADLRHHQGRDELLRFLDLSEVHHC